MYTVEPENSELSQILSPILYHLYVILRCGMLLFVLFMYTAKLEHSEPSHI